jgi:hypothetical protein
MYIEYTLKFLALQGDPYIYIHDIGKLSVNVRCLQSTVSTSQTSILKQTSGKAFCLKTFRKIILRQCWN